MFNKIILVGNITRDIELRYTQGGTAVSTTAIATSRKYKGQDGTQKEEVCFVDITFFGRTAEVANQYLKRGSKVLVEGKLKLDQWTDQSGGKRSKHTVTVESMQMLGDGKKEELKNNNENKNYDTTKHTSDNIPNQHINNYGSQANNSKLPEINDDEIPF